MKDYKKIPAKKIIPKSDICRKLTGKQREVIKLLQKNGTLMVDNNRKLFIKCGDDAKKVTYHSFYNLVNKGFVYHQTEWPYSYVLSETGTKIKV